MVCYGRGVKKVYEFDVVVLADETRAGTYNVVLVTYVIIFTMLKFYKGRCLILDKLGKLRLGCGMSGEG